MVVDETADIAKAGRDIVYGAGFDNNIICVDEKEVFVVASVADDLIAAMQRQRRLPGRIRRELRRLEKAIFAENRGPRTHGVINKDWVGKNAGVILAQHRRDGRRRTRADHRRRARGPSPGLDRAADAGAAGGAGAATWTTASPWPRRPSTASATRRACTRATSTP